MASFLTMAFQALADRKLRSVLTIMMVVIGVALLVAVNGLSTGISVFVDDQFEALGPNLLIVSTGGGLSFGGGGDDGAKLTDQEVDRIATVEGVQYAIPYIQTTATLSHGGSDQSTMILGIDTSKLSLIYPQFSIAKGEDLSPTDSIGMVLGSALADLEGDEPFADVGDTIKARYQKTASLELTQVPEYSTKTFSVRGIGSEIGISMSFIPIDNSAYISLSAANHFFDRKGEYDGLYVLTTDQELNEQVEESIEALYDVSVISPAAIADVASMITGALGGFLDSIAIVSLGVAAVGIVTTLWTSMMERIKEIGTLKALGYTKRQILVLFLNEALFIGILGGIGGIIIGMVGGTILSQIVVTGFAGGFGGGGGGGEAVFNPVFDLGSILLVFGIAIVLSVVAGYYPAKRAADLDPVVALRKE
ncbi:MAG: ABC transporter permease [Candidatus Hodarchaeota archaeon]